MASPSPPASPSPSPSLSPPSGNRPLPAAVVWDAQSGADGIRARERAAASSLPLLRTLPGLSASPPSWLHGLLSARGPPAEAPPLKRARGQELERENAGDAERESESFLRREPKRGSMLSEVPGGARGRPCSCACGGAWGKPNSPAGKQGPRRSAGWALRSQSPESAEDSQGSCSALEPAAGQRKRQRQGQCQGQLEGERQEQEEQEEEASSGHSASGDAVEGDSQQQRSRESSCSEAAQEAATKTRGPAPCVGHGKSAGAPGGLRPPCEAPHTPRAAAAMSPSPGPSPSGARDAAGALLFSLQLWLERVRVPRGRGGAPLEPSVQLLPGPSATSVAAQRHGVPQGDPWLAQRLLLALAEASPHLQQHLAHVAACAPPCLACTPSAQGDDEAESSIVQGAMPEPVCNRAGDTTGAPAASQPADAPPQQPLQKPLEEAGLAPVGAGTTPNPGLRALAQEYPGTVIADEAWEKLGSLRRRYFEPLHACFLALEQAAAAAAATADPGEQALARVGSKVMHEVVTFRRLILGLLVFFDAERRKIPARFGLHKLQRLEAEIHLILATMRKKAEGGVISLTEQVLRNFPASAVPPAGQDALPTFEVHQASSST